MVDTNPQVLIVDDEEVVCDVLHNELSERGYLCTTAFNGNGALAKLLAQDIDVVLLDIRLPGMSGIEVLRKMRSSHPGTAAVVITGINNIDVAVAAMKLGASDYIVKPFDLDKVDSSIRTALETRRTASKPSTRMDALARGVEAKLDPHSNYSKLVTEKTIDVARQLGIAEEETQRWAATKAELDSERDRVIKSV